MRFRAPNIRPGIDQSLIHWITSFNLIRPGHLLRNAYITCMYLHVFTKRSSASDEKGKLMFVWIFARDHPLLLQPAANLLAAR
jgi:hypothetical protein